MANYKIKLHNVKAFIFDVDGVLTDGKVLVKDGSMSRTMNTKDGFAMQYAIKKGYIIAIITGGKDQNVQQRCKDLGITDIYLNSQDKIEDYNDFKYKYNLQDSNILYMGDDIPDYQPMQKSGVAVCPADACPEIKSIADHISLIKGGNGCVREIIEQTLKTQNNWFKINESIPQSI